MAGPAYDTPVLDDFNRANEGPPPSSGWTGPIQVSSGSTSDLRVVSNTLQRTSDDLHCEAYWNTQMFAPPCEVFATVATQSREYFRLWLCIQNPNDDGDTNGYVLEFDYSSGTDALKAYRVDGGVFTQLGASISQEVSSGDSLGLSHSGTTLTVWYKAGAGEWSALTTRSDSTYQIGYIGCSIESPSGSNIVIDNFGGGREALTPALTLALLGA